MAIPGKIFAANASETMRAMEDHFPERADAPSAESISTVDDASVASAIVIDCRLVTRDSEGLNISCSVLARVGQLIHYLEIVAHRRGSHFYPVC
jgi:hypothetical protein